MLRRHSGLLGFVLLARKCDGHFVYFEELKDWASAEASCKAQGGHLAHIHNSFENDLAMALCAADRCWLGFNDIGKEDDWLWSDGGALSSSFPSHWKSGEPSNTDDNEDCMYIHGMSYPDTSVLGFWGDRPCEETHAYVCSVPEEPGVSVFHEWIPGDWNVCSSTCGWGIQNRLIQCKDSAGKVKSDSECDEATKPLSRASCYMKDCAPSKFTFYAEAKTWEDAESTCVQHGGHLAAVHSVDDVSLVFNLCEDERCWIGFNDRAEEGKFAWSDGSSTAGYSPPWAPGDPSNTGDGDGEDCAYVRGLYYLTTEKIAQWGDRPCSWTMPFVCQSPYKYFSTPLSWPDAESRCVSVGGHLANVYNAADADASFGVCAAERCWLGLNDRNEEGQWEWVGGAKLGSFKQWAPDEPNDDWGAEDCGYVHGRSYPDVSKQRKWGDHPCSEAQMFVCRLDDAHMKSDVMACTFSSGGASFDLTGLAGSTYSVHDVRSTLGATEYFYSFAVCGNTPGIPPGCKDTTGSDNEPKVHMTAAAPAYQHKTDGTSGCWRLGDDVHRVGNMEWALLDPVNPAAGVTLTYKNGNVCKDDIFDARECVAEYNYADYCHRQLKLVFACADDTANIPDEERVLESTGCEYIIELSSTHGCPTECPLVNNRLCNGHGVCGYDRDAGAARCYCNPGFGGRSCLAGESDDTGAKPPAGGGDGGGVAPPAPVTPRYFWKAGAFGACSASCGGGTKSRSVSCVDGRGTPMSSYFCASSPATPPESVSPCFLKPCPADTPGGGGGGGEAGDGGTDLPLSAQFQWVAQAWSECEPMESAGGATGGRRSTCGPGYQTRAVACMNGLSQHAYGRCAGWAVKPDVQRTCYIPCSAGGGASSVSGGDDGGSGTSGWTILGLTLCVVAVFAAAHMQFKDSFIAGRRGSLYNRLRGAEPSEIEMF